jgi:hypothetical protein
MRNKIKKTGVWCAGIALMMSISFADTTKWTTKGLDINVQVNDDAPKVFFAVGMCYGMAPIGDAGNLGIPYQDFFFYNPGDPKSQWGYIPIWERDIGSTEKPGLLRKMGVNSVRLYSMFKHAYTDVNNKDQYDKWSSLDWSTDKANPAEWWIHDGHEKFLDMCWNNGKDPIYVLIGVPFAEIPFGHPNNAVEAKLKDDAYHFFLKTAEWLAKKYGNHPAVMGFILGNEHDSEAGTVANIPGTPPENFYGPEYLIDIQGQPLQKVDDKNWKGMPGGNYWRTEYHDKLNAMAEVIKKNAPDKLVTSAWHDKQYFAAHWLAKANDDAMSIELIDEDVLSYSKLDFFSFNIYQYPQDALRDLKLRYIDYAKKTNRENLIRPVMFTEMGIPASTRDGGGNVVELPDNAKAQSDLVTKMWQQGIENRTGGGTGPYPFLSGIYTFAYADEWFKDGTPTVHNGREMAGDFFPGKHWDDEWFGLFRIEPNPKRLPGPKVTPNEAFKNQDDNTPLAERPVISDYSGGNLNGGPDILTPRAVVSSLTELYKKTGVGNPIPGDAPKSTAPTAPDTKVPVRGGHTPGIGDFLDN